MKSRAAVAFGPGQPLQIVEIDVAPPKKGEVLVKITHTGVCHTDAFTLSGDDPEGLFPVVLGHEGAGIVVEVGEGVTSVKPGDHVIPLYTAECGECLFCKSGKTNLCVAVRATRAGCDARWHQPLQLQRRAAVPLHGLLDLQRVHRRCRSLAGEDQPGRQPGTRLPARLRRHHRHRRGAQHRQGAGRRQRGGVRPGWHRPGGDPGCATGRIIAVDTNPSKFELAREFGATDCINPKDFDKPIQQVIVEMTIWGVDHSFECIGNVNVMRAALECAHRGWGQSVVIGVAGAGRRSPPARSSW